MSDVPGGYQASDGKWYSQDGRSVWDGERWVAHSTATSTGWAKPGDVATPLDVAEIKSRNSGLRKVAMWAGLAIVGFVVVGAIISPPKKDEDRAKARTANKADVRAAFSEASALGLGTTEATVSEMREGLQVLVVAASRYQAGGDYDSNFSKALAVASDRSRALSSCLLTSGDDDDRGLASAKAECPELLEEWLDALETFAAFA